MKRKYQPLWKEDIETESKMARIINDLMKRNRIPIEKVDRYGLTKATKHARQGKAQ